MGGNRFAFMHGLLARGVGQRVPALHNGFMEQSSRKREAISDSTLRAPADSPNTVMFSGSPPNAAMLSRTHSGLDLIEQCEVMHHALFLPSSAG